MKIRNQSLAAFLSVLFVLFISGSAGNAYADNNGQMTGTNMNLLITPSMFNPSTDNNVTLTFIPNSNVPTLVTDGVVKHLDYNITISKDGNDVFNYKFHTHNGNLTLVFTPSVQTGVTGGVSNPAQTTTGPFYINGPVFNNTGNYEISAQVVGVNFIPIIPLEDTFTVHAVPEFGSLAGIIIAISLIGAIAISTKFRLIQKV